ncbi:MAG: ferritin [Verrucomicrobiales bacterium]|nr:ferritin [Verrucomicrobiales bacterium]
MALTTPLQDAINAQIRNELQAHYNYLAMSIHFDRTAYAGFKNWFRLQAAEEYGHAMKLLDYLSDRDATIHLGDLTQPPTEFGSHPIEIFELSLAQEQNVTRQINDLYALAQQEKDFTTLHFLSWFLQEQVEEEASVTEMIDRLKLVGNDPAGLLQIDAEAGSRASATTLPTPPTGGAAGA